MIQSFSFSLLKFIIYTSYKELPESWNIIAHHDLMLNTSYLKALELSSPNNITLYYIGVFNSAELVGIAVIERVQLYLKDMFRKNNSSVLKTFFKNVISTVLKGNILVIGNLTHTGQHGIYFNDNKISPEDYLGTLLKAVDTLKEEIKVEAGKTIRAILFKDYFFNDRIHKAVEAFKIEKYNKVTVQPNMIMNIEPQWNTINDYVKSLNKKYRARYVRARKKLRNIEKRELDIDIIKKDSKPLHSLYSNVSNNAKINTFFLPEHHFYCFKKELLNNFKVFGYYYQGNLIGFYTLILNNAVLETYFLGYDSKYQYQNQLYLNMLYDMLGFAIENKFGSVVYARTAMEIKSSVGAKAIPMTMYIKHTNKFANAILKGIFNFMKPNQKSEERHPFKS